MRIDDFQFKLPEELIAQYPVSPRHASRLLCLDRESGAVKHQQFLNLIDHLSSDDLLVFNDTRVIPARLYGYKATGGKLEMLVERPISNCELLAHIRASKAPKIGAQLCFPSNHKMQVVDRQGDLFLCRLLTGDNLFDVLEQIGHIPLPPYINRQDDHDDRNRYQTIFAKNAGAVAAPTAGLHFDDTMMQALAQKGVQTTCITLHVGAGTFQPVRVTDVREHHMHSELIHVSESVCELINKTKERGSKVIAVGTTVVRSLETAAQSGLLKAYQGDTDIFIYPGYKFQVVDGLLTNFHLPGSTLLMLVSAFAGQKSVMRAYGEAITERYRFYSYGDAMLVF